MTITYTGKRGEGGDVEVKAIIRGVPCKLPVRLDVRRHSPDGFNWGYEGSGPAQLALAICCHATGDDLRAGHVYQDFKRKVVARWSDEWRMTKEEVLAAVEQIEKERANAGN